LKDPDITTGRCLALQQREWFVVLLVSDYGVGVRANIQPGHLDLVSFLSEFVISDNCSWHWWKLVINDDDKNSRDFC